MSLLFYFFLTMETLRAVREAETPAIVRNGNHGLTWILTFYLLHYRYKPVFSPACYPFMWRLYIYMLSTGARYDIQVPSKNMYHKYFHDFKMCENSKSR